jgi:hypothetical protein
MEKLSRAERMQHAKASLEKQEVEAKALAFSQKRHKNFKEIVDRLYNNEDLSAFFSDRRIALISECFRMLSAPAMKKDREALWNVLRYFSGPRGLVAGEEYVYVLCNIVGFRNHWLNDIFKWTPVSRHKSVQLQELVQFLFCKYPVPVFLYKAFGKGSNERYVQWLIHLGAGGSPKDLEGWPVIMTKKSMHHFLLAPEEFSIQEAMRWAQVKGLNGSDELAQRVAWSWIGTKPYEQEDFWYGFLQLIVNGGMFNIEKLTELIDYVREAKRVNPDYNLKGRTLQSLFRQSDAWHTRFSTKGSDYEWKPCGINGYKAKKNESVIKLEELTASRLLAQEGKNMKHCVHSYAFYCAKGRTAIFSMRNYVGDLFLETIATIEVNLQLRRIVQAKAKMNRPISSEARKHLVEWALKEHLEINAYV